MKFLAPILTLAVAALPAAAQYCHPTPAYQAPAYRQPAYYPQTYYQPVYYPVYQPVVLLPYPTYPVYGPPADPDAALKELALRRLLKDLGKADKADGPAPPLTPDEAAKAKAALTK